MHFITLVTNNESINSLIRSQIMITGDGHAQRGIAAAAPCLIYPTDHPLPGPRSPRNLAIKFPGRGGVHTQCDQSLQIRFLLAEIVALFDYFVSIHNDRNEQRKHNVNEQRHKNVQVKSETGILRGTVLTECSIL